MQKTIKSRDWLTPKVSQEQGENREESDVERVLRCLNAALNKEIAQQEQIKARADNKGKFGKYRYCEGVIAGLSEARSYIMDWLADEQGL